MKNDELKLTVEKLIMDESPLSPEKEITYKTVIRMLEEELASTMQELANYKKMVYGQKSEKSEIILEGGEQMSIFIATSKIAVTLDNYSKKWYNMSQGDEKNGQNAAQCGVESSC